MGACGLLSPGLLQTSAANLGESPRGRAKMSFWGLEILLFRPKTAYLSGTDKDEEKKLPEEVVL